MLTTPSSLLATVERTTLCTYQDTQEMLGIYNMTGTSNLSGMQFTTKDCDNDPNHVNCAIGQGSGWWYTLGCGHSSLNGQYLSGELTSWRGVSWYFMNNRWEPLRFAQMKLRFSD